MSYDIYGNPLRRGHCEVHPHVHEEYPCSVCIQENNSRNAQQQSESEHYEMMRLEHELELSQQRITELESQILKWISVKDNLPPVDVWVLWFDGDRTMNPNNAQYHIDKVDKRGECLMNYLHNYTHWMPLPRPPKEKDDE